MKMKLPHHPHRPRARVVPATLLCAAALVSIGPASAVPFVPKSADEVVERLPARIGSAADRENERRLRAQLAADPNQLPLALQLARRAIDRARLSGDPRELGQAEAVLAPWWPEAAPPPAVRLLRAIVRQSRHEFDASLQDLDALVRAGDTPLAMRAQAELTRASVLQVQGRWKDAEAGCARLAGADYASLGAPVAVPAEACLADLASLQGRFDDAERRLADIDRGEGSDSAWLSLVRAEMAERRGDPKAELHFIRAMQGGGDIYTLAAYADWLLAHRRPAEAIRLLDGRDAVDPLLLRLAIAYRDAGDPRAASAEAALAARFEAARERGDTSHGREQSRFALELAGDPAAALVQAQANWAAQKEPADALTLLKAAAAAKRPDAAEPVWRFARETGWTDVRLDAAKSGGAS